MFAILCDNIIELHVIEWEKINGFLVTHHWRHFKWNKWKKHSLKRAHAHALNGQTWIQQQLLFIGQCSFSKMRIVCNQLGSLGCFLFFGFHFFSVLIIHKFLVGILIRLGSLKLQIGRFYKQERNGCLGLWTDLINYFVCTHAMSIEKCREIWKQSERERENKSSTIQK